MLVGECLVCKDLLEAAQTATRRHIDAQSRLRMAEIRFDRQARPGLEGVLQKAALAREQALALLRDHAATHSEEICPAHG